MKKMMTIEDWLSNDDYTGRLNGRVIEHVRAGIEGTVYTGRWSVLFEGSDEYEFLPAGAYTMVEVELPDVMEAAVKAEEVVFAPVKSAAWENDLETLEVILMLEAIGLKPEYVGPNGETRYDLVKRVRGVNYDRVKPS